MSQLSRRRMVGALGAAPLLAGMPYIARAQAPITLRLSSSMVADQNAAHYVWYQQFEANLKATIGDRVRIEYFPNNLSLIHI